MSKHEYLVKVSDSMDKCVTCDARVAAVAYVNELEEENAAYKKQQSQADKRYLEMGAEIDGLKADNRKLREAFGLARSMVLGGEAMSPQAEEVFSHVMKGVGI